MPTYEYKCYACDHGFERFQSIKAEPVRKCPECGKSKVRRLVSTGTGLIFKGSGFYITDYRDKRYSDKAKSESGAAAPAKAAAGAEGGSATPVASTETKAVAKSEPSKTAKSDKKAS
jgi:putative FmdB family regulatory protein